jgi:hypothetical protein
MIRNQGSLLNAAFLNDGCERRYNRASKYSREENEAYAGGELEKHHGVCCSLVYGWRQW